MFTGQTHSTATTRRCGPIGPDVPSLRLPPRPGPTTPKLRSSWTSLAPHDTPLSYSRAPRTPTRPCLNLRRAAGPMRTSGAHRLPGTVLLARDNTPAVGPPVKVSTVAAPSARRLLSTHAGRVRHDVSVERHNDLTRRGVQITGTMCGYTRNPSSLPASRTGQWRACCVPSMQKGSYPFSAGELEKRGTTPFSAPRPAGPLAPRGPQAARRCCSDHPKVGAALRALRG